MWIHYNNGYVIKFTFIHDGEVFTIILNYLLNIREFSGCKSDSISGSFKIVDLINALSERYGSQFGKNMLNSDMTKLNDDITILVNGVNIIFLNDGNTILKDDDTITFLPEIMGG